VTPPGRLLGVGPFAGVLTGKRALAQPQPLPAEQLQVGEPLPAPAAEPYQGATALLRWRTRIILSAGNDQRHALSNKVEVTLQLRQLAREVGISQAGVAYIKALCASRCVLQAALLFVQRCGAHCVPQIHACDGHASAGEPAILHAGG